MRAKGKQRRLEEQRSAFITERTAYQLQELLAQSAVVRSGASQDRLFIHYRGGRPLAPNYVNVIVKQWAARCGIARNVYAYMARYTFCTRNLSDGGIDHYTRKLKVFVEWLNTAAVTEPITTLAIKRFLSEKHQQGCKRRTVAKYLYAVRQEPHARRHLRVRRPPGSPPLRFLRRKVVARVGYA